MQTRRDQMHELIRLYLNCWQQRYSRTALIGQDDVTHFGYLLDSLGFDKASVLIQDYLKDGGYRGYFVQQGHSPRTLRYNFYRVWVNGQQTVLHTETLAPSWLEQTEMQF